MELSDFLLQRKSNIQFPREGDHQPLVDEEEQLFKEFFPSESPSQLEDIRERLQYLRSYILNFPDYDGMGFFVSDEAFMHYKMRELKLSEIYLPEKEFYDFKEMQEAILELGLLPKPTFEFIFYLWHTLQGWLTNGINETMDARISRMKAKMDEQPEADISVDFKIGNKHFKFNNQNFIRALIENYINSDIVAGGLMETIYPKKREIDYLLLRTLLTYLPIKHKKPKKGTFSQAERTFCLCVLWFVGAINHKKTDDPLGNCSHDGNATFDKLMRDYSNLYLIPIIP